METRKLLLLITFLLMTSVGYAQAPDNYSYDSIATWTAGHMKSQIDPHGASMTVTQELTVGSGTADVTIERTAPGVISVSKLNVLTSLLVNGIDFAGHVLTTVDPHGVNMTVTESVTVGSGTADALIERVGVNELYIPELVLDVLTVAGYDFGDHVMNQIDPHGASMTVSDSLTVGVGPTTGYAETMAGEVAFFGVYRFKESLLLDDLLRLTPIATPTALLGVVFISNVNNHIYFYNGTDWKQLDN